MTTKTVAVLEFWQKFCDQDSVDPSTPFRSWYFGDSRELADELCELVLAGKKRATACLADDADDPDRPVEGQYCVVTDFDRQPKCVIRLTEVRTMPFNEVDADFAFDEGEGDQSLDFWRQAHWAFFSRYCATIGKTPDLHMPVTCQRFELLYPKPA